jgi:acyl carrier protein
MERNEEILKHVISVLVDLGVRKEDVKPESRLMEDLRVTGDDLSFVYVLNIQKIFGVKIPHAEWEHVETVNDTIELLKRYRSLQSH